MPQLKSNFIFKSKSPNFKRDSFNSLYEMRNMSPAWMNDGHIIYCRETGKHYTFNSNNEYNEVTGYFKLFESFSQDNNADLPSNLSTHIIYDTFDDMKNDNTNNLKLGQLVYCREDQNHYYYAFDDELENLDPNQISFDPTTGYFRLFNGDEINKLKQELTEIKDEIWPLNISLNNVSKTVRQGDTIPVISATWDITHKNLHLTADYIIVNGTKIIDQSTLISRHYDFTNISSPSLDNYKASRTNNISVHCNNKYKTASVVATFIYPKYYGWITGSADKIDSLEITGNNILNYVKSGEIINDQISQNISIPDYTYTGRWFYAFPASLGNVTSIVDGNGFNQMGGVSLSYITIADPITKKRIPYKVYIQNNSADLSNITIKIS